MITRRIVEPGWREHQLPSSKEATPGRDYEALEARYRAGKAFDEPLEAA